jgi:cytochrome c oxidase assembly protein subunit 15
LAIGVLSTVLAILTWLFETRRPARLLGLAIFAAVVVQGMLGGARVLMDAQTMALVHADFGAGVFSLMSVFVLVTGSRWESRSQVRDAASGQAARVMAVAVLVSMVIQYFLGGVLRHLVQGWAWMAHPWFALVPVLLSPCYLLVARRSGCELLIRGAKVLLLLIVSQALLGLATWYVRFGVPAWGVVAEQNSLSQIVVCSLHKVLGMLTLMTSVLNVVCANAVQSHSTNRISVDSRGFDGSVMGVAT